MAKTKAAVNSVTFWGALMGIATGISEIADHALGSGFVPPHVAPWLVLAGGAAALVGRLKKNIQSIGSIF